MGRGPSYPYIGLEEAIGIARKMYDYTKRAPAPVDSVITDAWGYTTTSSSGSKVLAALKAFGLIEDSAAASGKATIKLTPRSIRILLDDQDTPARRDEIKKAALSPKWYEFCWKHWGKEMPSSMKSTLLIEHGFVDSTVEGFLKDYRKTIAFAGLMDDVVFGKPTNEDEESDVRPKVGEYVQWECKGVLQMPEARKLLRIENHPDHGEFGIVEGYLSGIPFEELIRAETPVQDSKPKISAIVPPAITPLPRGEAKMQTETFSLPEGVTGQLQWPIEMSNDAFEDFLHQLEGLKRRVQRAVRRELQIGTQSEK